MSDYSGIDFALGSVRGFRRWKVDVTGVLNPITYSSRSDWLPGENVSSCQCTPSVEQLPKIEGEDWKARNKRSKEWRENASFEDMNCGFYAYFDGEDDHGHGSNDPNISGVIEGYGEVLIGTKGFRAKKARILAIAVPAFDGIWKLDEFVVAKIRANYPGIPLFESELAMRAEFPAPAYQPEVVLS